MIDFLSLFFDFIAICFIVLVVAIGIRFLYNLATVGQSNNSYSEETDNQLVKDSIEDSQGDGLVLFDDPLFPEEFNTDYDG